MNFLPIVTRLTLMNRLNRYKNSSIDLAKIKMAIAYIKGVRCLRSLFLKIIAAGLAIFLLINGLNLFYITFLFAPVTQISKAYIALFFVLYFGAVAGIILYFFSHRKWMEMFDIDELTEQFNNKKKSET